jgi:hypothetical protein
MLKLFSRFFGKRHKKEVVSSSYEIEYVEQGIELPSRMLLVDNKAMASNNQLYDNKINAVVTLYDWNLDSYSSKAFLAYLLRNMHPQPNNASLIYILDITVAIGLCSHTLFSKTTTTRKTNESAFEDALLRRRSMIHASLQRDIVQFERSIYAGFPIICLIDRRHVRRNHHIFCNVLRRQDNHEAIILIGYNRTRCGHFYFLHFMKESTQTFSISYQEMMLYGSGFHVMIPFGKTAAASRHDLYNLNII